PAALHHRPIRGEVERHHGDALELHVLPDVELAPVGEREDADALALVDPAVVEVPQLGPLVARIPLAAAVAKGEDALFGARFLLVAASAAERGVESALLERLQERLRLQREGVLLAGVVERVDPVVEGALVAMDD